MTPKRDVDAEYTAPEHSHLCMCETCTPKNRGALERLIAENEAMIARLDRKAQS